MKRFSTLIVLTGLIWLGTPPSPSVPATLEVRPPGGVGTLGDIYTSIQDAIDDANDGDTLNIHDGTYDETINIEDFNGLTLSGEDKTTVIIKSSSTLDWNVGTYGSSRKAVFRLVNSIGVVLENMTMDFDLVRANFVFGVMGWDSGVTVDNCILKNMSVDDLAGGYYDIGSYFRAPGYTDESRADVTMTNNTFIDMGRQGAATHDYVNADISGNTFYKTTDDFGYAIEIGSQSIGSVTGNTIYGYDTPAASDGSESAGIYIEPAFTGRLFGTPVSMVKPVTVQGNEVYDCQYAMWIGNGYDGYAGDIDIVINVSGNNFHNNVDGAVILQDEDAEDGSSITATFQGNTVTDNNSYGCHIFTNGDGDITATFNGETITGHDTGMLVADYAGGPSSSSYSVQVRNSNLSNNSSYGVDNAVSAIVVDAVENCWGDATGPYHPVTNPGGLGSQVSDYVAYYPWYLDCTLTTLVYKPVHNVTLDAYYDTIQEAIDAARNGDIIEVAAGTFTEDVAIDVSVILNGAQTGQDPRGGRSGGESEIVGSIRVLPGVADITVDGFKITGTELGAMKGVSMRIESPNSLIQNNIIVAVDGSGYDYSGIVDLEGITNTTIQRNDFSGVYDAARQPNVIRLGVTGPGVVLVTQNEMHNVGGGGGVGVMCSNNDAVINIIDNEIENTGDGIWFWDPVSGSFEVNIQSNTIFNCQKKGVKIVSPVGTAAVNCNRIYNNGEEGVYNGVPSLLVDAEFNWWGDASGPGPVGGGTGDEVSEYVDFFPWLLSTDCNDSTLHVADFVVDDDWAGLPNWTTITVGGVDYYIGLNAFVDIQPAVDAADGNSIYVQDGNYSPFTVDGKTDLTITSASTVTVEGVQSVATAYTDRDCVIFVKDSTNVVLQDLNVEGNGLGTFNDKSYGVIYENSSGHIKDCNISPNTVGDMSATGIGIWDGSDVKVDPTLIHNFGRIGIFIYNGCDVEVLDSEIVGQVYNDGNLVNYGIEVEGAWGSDDPNTASRVAIKRNVIYNCDNTDTEVKWGSSAILINGWLEYMAAADSTVTVVDNDIYNSYSGIYAIKSSSSRATLNNIYDNRVSGVESAPAHDSSTVVFDAEYNWWGDASGPNDPNGTTETDGTTCPDVSVIKNADGLGDEVSENVTYCAWLTAPACTSTWPCLAGDLNYDDCVNWLDVAILAANWLEGCE